MMIVLFILVFEIVIMFLLSKNKYTLVLDKVSSKEYSIKRLLPIGFLIIDSLHYSFISKYDHQLHKKMMFLKGKNKALFYRKVHWAEKIVYLHLSLLLVVLFITLNGLSFTGIFYGVLLILISIFLKDWELDQKIKTLRRLINKDFIHFIDRLSLLVGTGLTLPRAWQLAIPKGSETSYFYKKALELSEKVHRGISFNEALESFSMDFRSKEISRFTSILIQNYLKGSEDIARVLNEQSLYLLENQKRQVKMASERANNQLLIPMIFILIGILIILSIPALLMLKNI